VDVEVLFKLLIIFIIVMCT